MNKSTLQSLVTSAVELDREIAERQEQLKEIKAELIEEARNRPDEHSITEGGGRSWSAEGTDGCIARVSFPAAALKDKIAGVGKTIEKIMEAAGRRFADLFDQAPSWKLKPDFRKVLDTQFSAVEARKLLKLCSTESAPRVSFETKENHEA